MSVSDADRSISGTTTDSVADHAKLALLRLTRPRTMGIFFGVPMIMAAATDIRTGLAGCVAAGIILVGALALVIAVHCLSGKHRKLVTYAFGRDHISAHDATGTGNQISWSRICKTVEEESGFVIHIQGAGPGWITKRPFSQADVRAIRELMREKLGANARIW